MNENSINVILSANSRSLNWKEGLKFKKLHDFQAKFTINLSVLVDIIK